MTLESRAFGRGGARAGRCTSCSGWLGIEWPRSPLNLSVLLALAAARGGVPAAVAHRGRATRCARSASRPRRRATPASGRARRSCSRWLLSGALAGLVGINEIAGVHGRLLLDFVGRRRLRRHRGVADRAQPPGGHRAGVAAVRRAVPGRRRAGVRDRRLQPRHGVHAAGADRAVRRRDGAGGGAGAGAALARSPAAGVPRRPAHG